MGSDVCKMHEKQEKQWKFMGFIKEGIEKGPVAQLTVRINYLDKDRDIIQVEYPADRSSMLQVFINDKDISTTVPGGIVINECQHKVTYGEEGKIVIKMKKADPKEWARGWSPSRILQPSQPPAVEYTAPAIEEP